MKRKGKIALLFGILTFGVIGLSSCTQSFCSSGDTANILYRYDYGVTKYYNKDEAPEGATKLWDDNENIYCTISLDNDAGLNNIITNARQNNIEVPYYLDYWKKFDEKVLEKALSYAHKTHADITKVDDLTLNDYTNYENSGVLSRYGSIKFFDNSEVSNAALWDSWLAFHQTVAYEMANEGHLDRIPTNDFVTYYKSQMNSYVSSYRACFANETGYFGNYGYGTDKDLVIITGKDWGYAWSKGFFEGLLVYPIGWLINTFAKGFYNAGAAGAAILSIIFVTIIIRGLMLVLTIKQSSDTAKMNELQPKIQQIQAKYPNSNKNQYEKQRMNEEVQKLYKKNNIKPFRSIIVMIIQFPIFICVWGAMQGSAALATGSFLGLNLNDSIKDVLFNSANWTSSNMGGLTALILFLLMSAAQVVAMLLPQWIQKRKAKKTPQLGKNPAAKSQGNKMKWFTYIMLALIIFMGFSLVSAMGVYWLIGALISIAQTLITQAINDHKKKKEN